MSIYHIHHIVPRHAGGTDNPENLIKVTVAEHAAFHYERWIMLNELYDYIAWKSLSKQITFAEATKLAHRKGSKKGGKSLQAYVHSDDKIFKDFTNRISKTLKEYYSCYGHHWVGKEHSEKTKDKIGEKNSISQLGTKNSQYGTMWITNGSINKKIKKNDYIPNGWYKGRLV
jgi:hypothetical protein